MSTIYLDNDFTVTYLVERFSSQTPAGYRPALGLTDLKAKLCATNALDADPIHPTLEVTLVEDGTTGFYHGTFEGSDITAHLASYSSVVLVIYHEQDLRIVEVCKVVQQRRAT